LALSLTDVADACAPSPNASSVLPAATATSVLPVASALPTFNQSSAADHFAAAAAAAATIANLVPVSAAADVADSLTHLVAQAEARDASASTLATRHEVNSLSAALAATRARLQPTPLLGKRKQPDDDAITILPMEQHPDVFSLWARYVSQYRPREAKGTDWRKGHNNAQLWGVLGFIFREVARRYDEGEIAAVRAMEARRVSSGSWTKLVRTLKTEQPDGRESVRATLKAELLRLSPEPAGAVSAAA